MSTYRLLNEDLLKPLEHTVAVRSRQYPVWQYGSETSRPNCILIGSGRLSFRSLPPELLSIFNLYVSDLYWGADHGLPAETVSVLRMSDMVDDVVELVKALGVEQPMLFAHSCYGILALEVAKRSDCPLAGLILMAAAPQWTTAAISTSLERFRREADTETVAQYERQRARHEEQRQEGESTLSVNAYIADTAIYWGDRHVSESFIRQLWNGLSIDESIANHFWGDLLPNSFRDGLARNIDDVGAPVLLVGGRSDYDSCPLHTWEERFRPPHFSVADCGDVGHWPSLENPAGFTEAIKSWLATNSPEK